MNTVIDARITMALGLSSQQIFPGALAMLHQVIDDPFVDHAQLPILYDEAGKIYAQMGRYQHAIEYFLKALSLDDDARYHIHLASTYWKLGDRDKTHRILTQLVAEATRLPAFLRGLLFANLALSEAYHDFHEEALAHTLQSLQSLHEAGIKEWDADMYTNLGLHHLELHHDKEAEQAFHYACSLRPNDNLPALAELCRLYMFQGNIDQSLQFARSCLQLVWSSSMTYEKEELARLCLLAAHLAHHLGKSDLSVRLVEKAQLFYGTLRLWKEWQEAQWLTDEWKHTEVIKSEISHAQDTMLLHQFVILLDAITAQELLGDTFPLYLDIRVAHAQKLGQSMQLTNEELHWLTYVCRFADLGLTAMETDIVHDPSRSRPAWQQYTKHPFLSVDMLASSRLPHEVNAIIEAHHEHFDGTGFPLHQVGHDIPLLARIFAIVDYYAYAYVIQQRHHDEILQDIAKQSACYFDPDICKKFLAIYMTTSS